MYSYVKDNEQTARTAKGIKKQVIKKNITHDNYKEVLFNNKQMQHTMKTIRSKNHQLGSFELNKFHSRASTIKDSYIKMAYKFRLRSLQNLKNATSRQK